MYPSPDQHLYEILMKDPASAHLLPKDAKVSSQELPFSSKIFRIMHKLGRKEENMTIWNELLGNQVLISAVLGWTVAQFLKTVIDMVLNRSFNPERIFGSGGMPSSHSATVCALTTASGMKYGVGSFEFAVSFVLAMIVMYDAMGVRRETGKQAKLLNSVFFENILNLDGVFLQEKLKEYVGHTPLQVVAGAILGILIAVLIG